MSQWWDCDNRKTSNFFVSAEQLRSKKDFVDLFTRREKKTWSAQHETSENKKIVFFLSTLKKKLFSIKNIFVGSDEKFFSSVQMQILSLEVTGKLLFFHFFLLKQFRLHFLNTFEFLPSFIPFSGINKA